MTVWTHAVLSVLYACVSEVQQSIFCICTFSTEKFSMCHMEKRFRNTLIIIITKLSFAPHIRALKVCVPPRSSLLSLPADITYVIGQLGQQLCDGSNKSADVTDVLSEAKQDN